MAVNLCLSPFEMPRIVLHRIQDVSTFGSYIDAEYVYHYVTKGRCEFRVEDRLYALDVGHVLLIPPCTPHALLRSPGTDYPHMYVIHFMYHTAVGQADPVPLVVALPPPDRTRVTELFRILSHERERKQPGYELIASGVLAEMLGLHVRNSCSAPAPTPATSYLWRNVEEALRLMHGELEKNWSVEEISATVGLSTSCFYRAFKAYTGRTPHAFLNHARLEKAKTLLGAGGLNCSQAAEKVGFSSVHLFSRVFKQHNGVSPTRWAEEYLL